ncbi:MAG: penicillin-binding protein 2 [bacterium]|nr:penicillin-binding protein 2 [bacterium]
MKLNNSEHKRAFILFIFFAVWVLFICGWLVKLQVFNYSKNVERVRRQSNRIFKLNPKRGTIYDSKGEIMAISIKAKSAFLSNRNNIQSVSLFKRIRREIKISRKETGKIKDRIRRGVKFIWLKRKLSKKEYQRLAKIKKDNKSSSILDFVDEYKRVYPQKSTACHILGGVGVDEQGLYGIEYSLDSTLKGKGGKARVMRDARRKVFKLSYLDEPAFGKDIHLSIDSSIQFFVENALKNTVEKHNAKGGSVIVMDSRNSSVLAMANYPGFRPDRIRHTASKTLRNGAISFIYHPGSTFKIVLAATALEQNICTPQQEFNCFNGVYKVRDRKITDVHAYSRLSFEDVIVHSSNIGAARIGEKLGKMRYYNGIKKFGFGSRMGIHLPAEEKGILNPVKKWSGVSVAFLSHGYEIAVTPMQMARVYNVIASGGYLMRPTLLKKVDGVFLEGNKQKRILSRGTAHRMTAIMTDVVNLGTGKKTRIEGMKIAGKTGTTKKIRKRGRRKYIASFGGFFPAGNPRITMFVVIDEPRGVYYGGDVAAPLFKAIAEKLSIYLRIFPGLDKKNEIRL